MKKFYFVFFVSVMALCHSLLFCDLGQLQGELTKLGQSLSRLEKDLNKVVAKDGKKVTKIADGQYQYGDVGIYLVSEDITKMNVDAIVNAANSMLPSSPGGVAGAIWNAAGADQLNKWVATLPTKNGVKIPLGGAVTSLSFDLTKHRIKYIIHAVGPNCNAGQNVSEIYNTYKNSLLQANENNVISISFPAISTAIFGCNKKQCAQYAIQAIKATVLQTSVKKVFLSYFTDNQYKTYLIEQLEK